MSYFLRIALAVVVAVCGLLLTAVFIKSAVRYGNVLDYVKSFAAVFITIRLLLWLRKDHTEKKEQAVNVSQGRNTKMIAIGLAIGLGAPFVLLWLIKSAIR